MDSHFFPIRNTGQFERIPGPDIQKKRKTISQQFTCWMRVIGNRNPWSIWHRSRSLSDVTQWSINNAQSRYSYPKITFPYRNYSTTWLGSNGHNCSQIVKECVEWDVYKNKLIIGVLSTIEGGDYKYQSPPKLEYCFRCYFVTIELKHVHRRFCSHTLHSDLRRKSKTSFFIASANSVQNSTREACNYSSFAKSRTCGWNRDFVVISNAYLTWCKTPKVK